MVGYIPLLQSLIISDFDYIGTASSKTGELWSAIYPTPISINNLAIIKTTYVS
jgi:hypothetical protein